MWRVGATAGETFACLNGAALFVLPPTLCTEYVYVRVLPLCTCPLSVCAEGVVPRSWATGRAGEAPGRGRPRRGAGPGHGGLRPPTVSGAGVELGRARSRGQAAAGPTAPTGRVGPAASSPGTPESASGGPARLVQLHLLAR
eukprot:gene11861-biopygen16895